MSINPRETRCKVEGCEQSVHARAYCQKHYIQIWRMGVANRNTRCCVTGCSAPVHAKAYCRRHYTQVWRKGEISRAPAWHARREQPTRAVRERRLHILEAELKKVEEMYDRVVGFENRLRWRREVSAVQTEIETLQEAAV
jgi:hypothetical protein